MTTTSTSAAPVKPVPDHMHTVTPHLVCAGAVEAIEFYKRAFGATEMTRLAAQSGKLMHAMLRLGDSTIMLTDENPEWNVRGPLALKGTPVTIHLQVPDADGVFAAAVAAGAKGMMPVQEMFWGDRYGVVQDPYGHQWSIATHVHDLTHEEIEAAAAAQMCHQS